MTLLKKLIRRFPMDMSGAVAIEYCLLAGLITAVIIASLTHMGSITASKFTAVAGNLS